MKREDSLTICASGQTFEVPEYNDMVMKVLCSMKFIAQACTPLI